jgi:hypothetical protein
MNQAENADVSFDFAPQRNTNQIFNTRRTPMNTTALRTLLAAAASVSIAFTATQTLDAQCVSGMGATPAQFASQNFSGPSGVAIVVTSLWNSVLGRTPLSNVTDIAINQGQVYIAMNGQVRGAQFTNRALETGGAGSPGNSQSKNLFVAGIVWGENPGNFLYPWGITPDSMNAIPMTPIPMNGATVAGATFDGTYAWFTTNKGQLRKVQPPPQDGQPVDLGNIKISSNPLGAILFDGRWLWIGEGSNLLQFDPTTSQLVSTTEVGITAGSLTFDGVYLWISGSSTRSLQKFDPVTLKIVSTAPLSGAAFTNVFFDGAVVTGYSSTNTYIHRFRACDGSMLPNSTAPIIPLKTAFDGTHYYSLSPAGDTIYIQ